MKKKNIHFVGIKGVGMTPLAIIAKEAGFHVSGCDIDEVFITDVPLTQSGITALPGFSPDHLEGIDMVITTGAHGGFDNPEVVAARVRGIAIIPQGQALGMFISGELLGKVYDGIAVAGSHGKTTTTAMITTILKGAGQNPSWAIGTSTIPSIGLPGHYARGNYFVAEADEYITEPTYDKTPKLLWLHPKIAVITNLELDHTDAYPTIDLLEDAFVQFAGQITADGVLIACGDDPQVASLLKRYRGNVITYGFSPANMYVIKRASISGYKTFFWVAANKTSLGEFSLSVPGEHNALNATAAIIAASECGIPLPIIKKTLATYSGSRRRFEYIGKTKDGALLYDDYAHHPTEITKTLGAFRKSFPKAHIICVFQSHTYTRTKSLFEQFITSFGEANEVVVTNIYPSLREAQESPAASRQFAQAVSMHHKHVLFLPKLIDVVKYIDTKQYSDNTIILTMGAGDVYKVAEQLLDKTKDKSTK